MRQIISLATLCRFHGCPCTRISSKTTTSHSQETGPCPWTLSTLLFIKFALEPVRLNDEITELPIQLLLKCTARYCRRASPWHFRGSQLEALGLPRPDSAWWKPEFLVLASRFGIEKRLQECDFGTRTKAQGIKDEYSAMLQSSLDLLKIFSTATTQEGFIRIRARTVPVFPRTVFPPARTDPDFFFYRPDHLVLAWDEWNWVVDCSRRLAMQEEEETSWRGVKKAEMGVK